MICPNCSTVLADDSLQCTNCGAHVVPTTEYPYGSDGSGTAGATQFRGEQAAQQSSDRSAFRNGFEQGYDWAQGRKQTDAQQAYQQAYQQGYEQGYQQGYSGYYQAPPAPPVFPESRKNHIVAGLLAIFLGTLGIHKYYLGYTTQGTTMLLITLIGSIFTFGLAYLVMAIIALIEGIIYLTKDDATFYYTYELGNKPWF